MQFLYDKNLGKIWCSAVLKVLTCTSNNDIRIELHRENGRWWFRPVTSSPRYSSPLKEPGSPPKTIEFAPCTSGSCLSTSVNTLTFFCLCLLEV